MSCSGGSGSHLRAFSVLTGSRRSVILIEYRSIDGGAGDGFGSGLRLLGRRVNRVEGALDYVFSKTGLGFGFVLTARGCTLSRLSGLILSGVKNMRFSRSVVRCCVGVCDRVKVTTECRLLKSLFFSRRVPRVSGGVPTVEKGVNKRICCSFSVRPRGLLGVNCILRHGGTGAGVVPACRQVVRGNQLSTVGGFLRRSGKCFPGSVVVDVSSNGGGGLRFRRSDGVYSAVTSMNFLFLPGECESTCVVSNRRQLCNCTGSGCGAAGAVPIITFRGLSEGRRIGLFVRVGRGRGTISGGLEGALGTSLL